jgi:hypothetical protein
MKYDIKKETVLLFFPEKRRWKKIKGKNEKQLKKVFISPFSEWRNKRLYRAVFLVK